MTNLHVAHTADMTTEELQAVRTLLDGAFTTDEAYTEDDHEHALGGVHALLWEEEELVGYGSVVMRRLLHDGQALRTGYVEAVAVHPHRRRRGHGGVVMPSVRAAWPAPSTQRVLGRCRPARSASSPLSAWSAPRTRKAASTSCRAARR